MQTRFAALPECRIAYLHHKARGTPRGTVVAVHGLTRQKRDFDALAAALAARGYDVIAPDAPGRGESAWLPNPLLYNLDYYARVFAAFLRHLDLPPFHWIGSSMGGLIALTMAHTGLMPPCRSVTLVDITHRPNRDACRRIADYVTTTHPVFADVGAYEKILRQNLPLGPVGDDVWRHFAQHQLEQTAGGWTFRHDPAIALLAQAALRMPIDLSAGMAALDSPVALVAGAESDLCTAAEISDFRAMKPAAPVHLCAGAGHVPALTDAATQDFIGRFIDEN